MTTTTVWQVDGQTLAIYSEIEVTREITDFQEIKEGPDGSFSERSPRPAVGRIRVHLPVSTVYSSYVLLDMRHVTPLSETGDVA